ncbi:MAG: hypothetical protein JKY08_06095 [Flavobacteriaceae bacterium]|nr:hypothetical protein [Flavobacteriaceae bacterium]
MKNITFGNQYENTIEIEKDGKRIRFYAVDLVFKQHDKINRLSYTIRVQYHKQIDRSSWIVSMNKSDVYLNNKIPHTYKQRLDLEFGINVLYPLQMVVNDKGNLKWITNNSYKALLKRYEIFKETSLKENTGIYIENYLTSLEKKIHSKKLLTHHFQTDWFWGLYFQPVRGHTKNTSCTLTLPFETYKEPLAYKGLILPIKEQSYYNTNQVKFKGTITPNPYSKYYANGKGKGIINVLYDFDIDTHMIQNITANHQVLNNNKSVIKDVVIKILHLKEKDLESKPLKTKRSFSEKMADWLNK